MIHGRVSDHKIVACVLKKEANSDFNEKASMYFQVPSLPIQEESRNECPEIGS